MQAVGKQTTTVVTTCFNKGNEIPQDVCKDITYDNNTFLKGKLYRCQVRTLVKIYVQRSDQESVKEIPRVQNKITAFSLNL